MTHSKFFFKVLAVLIISVIAAFSAILFARFGAGGGQEVFAAAQTLSSAESFPQYDNFTAEHDLSFKGSVHGVSHSGKALTATKGEIKAGKYYLKSDLILTGRLVIAPQTTVEICLNGYEISTAKISYGSGKCAFSVGEKATLRLYDCCGEECGEEGHNHTFKNPVGGGTESVRGGLITSDGSVTVSGGGVSVEKDGNFIMDGGAIAGNSAINGSQYGGAVYMYDGGSFTLNGGFIGYNKVSQDGGGIYAENGRVTVNGGCIYGNSSSLGGGVYVTGKGSSFLMCGGAISSCNAGQYGGVYVKSGSFFMSGGEISSNSAESFGGVYVAGGAVEISGSPRIADNMGGQKSQNLFIPKGEIISAGSLGTGASIGVSVTADEQFACDVAESCLGCFVSDDGYACAELSAGGLRFHASHCAAGDWVTVNEGDGLSPRTQSRLCSVCGKAAEERYLTLCGLEIVYEKSVKAFDKVKIDKVTATYGADGEDGICDRKEVKNYDVLYNDGNCCRGGDTFVTVSYSSGGQSVSQKLEIKVSPLLLEISGDERQFVYDGSYQRYIPDGGGQYVSVEGGCQREAGEYEVRVRALREYEKDIAIAGAQDGELVFTFDIFPKPIAATDIIKDNIEVKDKFYDGTCDIEVGLRGNILGKVVCGGDDLSACVAGNSAFCSPEAGQGAEAYIYIGLQGKDARNYVLPRNFFITAHADIYKRYAAAEIDGPRSFPYGDKGDFSVSFRAGYIDLRGGREFVGFPLESDLSHGGPQLTLLYAPAGSVDFSPTLPTEVGKYAARACLTGESAQNYELAGDADIFFEITKRVLPVAAQFTRPERLYESGSLPAITCAYSDFGAIAWNDEGLIVGTHAYGWSFTPFDGAHYESVEGSENFTVLAVKLGSLKAEFDCGDDKIYTSTPLESLRKYITVRGTNNDGSQYTGEINYVIQGNLRVGECPLTLSYGGLYTQIFLTVLPPEVLSLSLVGRPYRTEYTAYEDFDCAGIKLVARLCDKTERVLANGEYGVADGKNLQASQTYVTLTYRGAAIKIEISVGKLAVVPPAISPKPATGSRIAATVADGDYYTVVKNDGGKEAGIYPVVLRLKDGKNCFWQGAEGEVLQGAEGEEITLDFTILRTKAEYVSKGVYRPQVILLSEQGLDPSLELSVESGENLVSKASALLPEGLYVRAAYKISLVGSGTESTASGKICLKILVPSELRGGRFKIISLNGADGVDDISYSLNADYAIVNLEELGTIAFVTEDNFKWDLAVFATGAVIGTAVLIILALPVQCIVREIKSRRNEKKKR